jgi:hypothetical protein
MIGTKEFLIAGAAIAFLYEMVALYRDDLVLISTGYRRMGQERTPAVIYFGGVLVGHFWVQPPPGLTLASALPEAVEIGLTVFIGAVIFGVFYLRREALPLKWWGNALLALFGGLVGATVWTMAM